MKRTFKYAMFILVVISLLGTSILASTINQLEDKKEDLEKDISDTKKQVNSLESSIKTMNSNLQSLESKIIAATNAIDLYETQSVQKQVEIDKTKEELVQVNKEKDEYYELAKNRIKVMYEYGNTGYLEVILNSKNLFDFFYRMEYINKVLAYDKDVFANLEEIMTSIAEKEEKLEKDKAEIEHLKAEATLEKSNLEELVISKAIEIKAIESNKEELEKQLKVLEREEAQIDQEIRNLMGQNGSNYDGSKFSWPVPGWYYISSYFGYRDSPIFGKKEFHNGLDIPAAYGSNIIAAANGTVILAKLSSSFGYYLVIDHGSGYSTLYAHNSKLLVGVGDKVLRGDVIAKAGSTGWSTGNHLHFEVRVNGKRVNPLDYVTTK